jgi:hypothetical protein
MESVEFVECILKEQESEKKRLALTFVSRTHFVPLFCFHPLPDEIDNH